MDNVGWAGNDVDLERTVGRTFKLLLNDVCFFLRRKRDGVKEFLVY